MHICIIVVLLLYSGAVSGSLEKVLRLAEFIADIYQQFPHSCIFIINPEAQQQGEDLFCIIYNSFVLFLNRNVMTEIWDSVFAISNLLPSGFWPTVSVYTILVQVLYYNNSRNLTTQLFIVNFTRGKAVAQWLRCCATIRKVAGSIPAGVMEFFIDIKSVRTHYDPGVESASNRNENQEHLLGVKAAGA